MTRFAFEFQRPYAAYLRLLGISPARAFAEVDAVSLRVQFGRWSLQTPLSNIVSAEASGPFRPWRVIGPHLSLADRGVTFGSTTRAGVCMVFAEPVQALSRRNRLRHPNATLTVSDAAGLVRALTGR